MKIEVHARVDQKAEASDQSARMIGEASRIALRAENLPGSPKKKNQKSQPAKAADHARFGKGFRVIIVRVIYDEAVIGRFVKRKDFLQGAQARSQDSVILEDQ